ncbi:MAG: ABC transporter substrate-binding protein [Ardenticatenaceae bacterium]|nr:ABC transporter substrate-binding protein [Ardenticatenaceae bacterium]HBY92500.1 ABC transporter substrate-binding protein [Chloroflexota bacterium]
MCAAKKKEEVQVVEAFLRGRMSRRQFLRKASLLGLSTPFISSILAACSSGPSIATTAPSPVVATMVPTAAASLAATSAPTQVAAQAGGTVVLGVTSDVTSLDPAHALANFKNLAITLYDRLVDVSGVSTEVKPSLATSWTISPDAKEYTFQLRKDVKFHDGTPFNAQAVKYTWDRMLDEKHPAHRPPYPYLGFFYSSLAEVQVVDDYTVKFLLKQPDAVFLSQLTWLPASPVSPAALEKYGEKFDENPVGTGPFRFVSWAKDQQLVVERNPDYWAGPPKLERVVIKPVPDEATRVIQLQKGDVDIVTDVSPEFIPFIEADQNLQVQAHPGLHTWWIAINMEEEPFKDKRVRQALNYAVDKEAIIRDVLHGAADPSTGFVWPGTWAYEPNVQVYKHDPDKAKQLLADAGYAEGLSTRFVSPVSGSMMVSPRELATVVQANLREVGVQASIDTIEWTSYLGSLLQGTQPYGLAEMGWGNNTDDPGQYVSLQLTTAFEPPAGYNLSFFSNPQVDDLLNKASTTIKQDERTELYKEAQRIVADEAPWIFMFHAKYVVASRRRVQGLVVGANFNRLGLTTATASSS